MSAWAGHLLRAISEALGSRPCEALTVDDLCGFVFPDALVIEKKHRVAVIRGMGTIAQQRTDLVLSHANLLGGRGRSLLILFHRAQVRSVRESLRARRMWLLDDRQSSEWIRRRFNPECREPPVEQFETRDHFTELALSERRGIGPEICQLRRRQ